MNKNTTMLTGIVVTSIAGMSIMFGRAMMTWPLKVFRLCEQPFLDPDRRRRVSLVLYITMLQQQILSETSKVSNKKLARRSLARLALREEPEAR